MSSLVLWAFIAELWLFGLIIWGAFNEEKFISFERKIGRFFKFYVSTVKQAVRERRSAK